MKSVEKAEKIGKRKYFNWLIIPKESDIRRQNISRSMSSAQRRLADKNFYRISKSKHVDGWRKERIQRAVCLKIGRREEKAEHEAVDVGFNFASTVITDIEYKYCVQEELNNVPTSTPLEEQANGYSFINLDEGSNVDGEVITHQKEVALIVEGGTLPNGFSTNPESPSEVGTVTIYVNASAA